MKELQEHTFYSAQFGHRKFVLAEDVEKLHALIDLLIKLNHQNRENEAALKAVQALPVGHFTFEYCTVKVDIGRVSGKSAYIHANSDDKTLIVVRKIHAKDEYRGLPATVLTPGEIIMRKGRGTFQFERIYFDEPLSLFRDRHQMHEIYAFLSIPLVKQTFIWLGC